MKMRMKKLISTSTVPVLALALLLVLGTVLSDGAAAQAKKPAPTLTGTTEYDFVGHLGIFDAEGRLLGWIGTISGDIEGVIHWWVVLPMKTTGQITHWVSRWEIWSDDPLQENSEAVLLLAGDDAGTNIVRHEKNSIWRANGIVTEAYGEFQDWIGRQVHEDGNLNWDFPYWGSGILRVN